MKRHSNKKIPGLVYRTYGILLSHDKEIKRAARRLSIGKKERVSESAVIRILAQYAKFLVSREKWSCGHKNGCTCSHDRDDQSMTIDLTQNEKPR
jgi:hypothetical protein